MYGMLKILSTQWVTLQWGWSKKKEVNGTSTLNMSNVGRRPRLILLGSNASKPLYISEELQKSLIFIQLVHSPTQSLIYLIHSNVAIWDSKREKQYCRTNLKLYSSRNDWTKTKLGLCWNMLSVLSSSTLLWLTFAFPRKDLSLRDQY